MTASHLLLESSVGYAVFKVKLQGDTVGARLKEVQEKGQDLAHFGKMVELVSFAPFQGAQQALSDANDVSEGIVSEYLHTVLETALPKSNKKKTTLGVFDRQLASTIKAAFSYVECETPETSADVAELLRGLRTHGGKLLKQLQPGDIERAQLGLGHSYSRAKVKFSVQKNDRNIIEAIAILDQLDKAVNTFTMRVREWYSWHFPELTKVVSDTKLYASLVLFIGDKSTLSEDKLHDLAALVNDDESVARSIIEAARVSMGRDISEGDLEHILHFAERAVSLAQYRKNIASYLSAKMNVVAPNLAALIGDVVGARLISKAGSLTNLSKFAASTVQILGAEKALFRALKTKGNTPKYGLIYHSSFIGKAGAKNKGRISRFLANKCSIASRIDNFSETPTTRFGEAMKKQVEDRIKFYTTGEAPTKNQDAMEEAMNAILGDINIENPDTTAAAEEEMSDDGVPGVTAAATEQKARAKASKEEKKKEKKEKKEKRKSEVNGDADAKAEKKKKKRKHSEVDGELEGKKKKSKKGKA